MHAQKCYQSCCFHLGCLAFSFLTGGIIDQVPMYGYLQILSNSISFKDFIEKTAMLKCRKVFSIFHSEKCCRAKSWNYWAFWLSLFGEKTFFFLYHKMNFILLFRFLLFIHSSLTAANPFQPRCVVYRFIDEIFEGKFKLKNYTFQWIDSAEKWIDENLRFERRCSVRNVRLFRSRRFGQYC